MGFLFPVVRAQPKTKRSVSFVEAKDGSRLACPLLLAVVVSSRSCCW